MFPFNISLIAIVVWLYRVIWLHCVNASDNKHRITAVGCQNGFVVVRVVDLSTNRKQPGFIYFAYIHMLRHKLLIITIIIYLC